MKNEFSVEFDMPDASLTTLVGANFSGRSMILRYISGFDNNFNQSDKIPAYNSNPVYISPEIYNMISGLAPTVEQELQIYKRNDYYKEIIKMLEEEIEFTPLYYRNPFTLSGGEQVWLVFLSALSMNPPIVSIDNALEQLSPESKKIFLEFVQKKRFDKTSFLLSDNRIDDLPYVGSTFSMKEDKINSVEKKLDIFPINSSNKFCFLNQISYHLSLEGITFGYRRKELVLKNISYKLNPGKIYFLSGKNGAGKSTLSKLLCGILKPQSGRLLFNSTPIKPWRNPGKIVGYHFQNPDVQLFSTTIEEELASAPIAFRLCRREIDYRVNTLLYAFGLNSLRSYHPLDDEIPFVLRKRIAIATTLSMGTPWLIFDEPTLGQDKETCIELAKIFRNFAENGTGIIVISHSNWFKSVVCDEEIRLDKGVL